MIWFTADEHMDHANILGFCARPFASLNEMEAVLIANHNRLVQPGDLTIHCGDFAFQQSTVDRVLPQLSGQHTFLLGSHDKWLKRLGLAGPAPLWLWEGNWEGTHLVACHYPMRSWPRSYHGSVQAFGHTHGRLKPLRNQWDVGVDHNAFCPISATQLIALARGVEEDAR